jgi:hypothetical protein
MSREQEARVFTEYRISTNDNRYLGYRPGMAASQPLDLDTALRRSGVVPKSGWYASVAVRPAPWWLVRLWGSGVEAMALPRVVFTSDAALDRIVGGEAAGLLVHESVHIDQWRRYGIARFLTRYLGDYLKGRAVGLPHRTAYRAIRFEREATERTERG